MDFDLGVAWEWPLDAPFIERLAESVSRRGGKALQITRANLDLVKRDLAAGDLRLRRLVDRASDEYPEYATLAMGLERAGTRVINRVWPQLQSADKARTHELCRANNVPVPITVIAPPYASDPAAPHLPAALGRPFVAKPASGGGGLGVILNVAGDEDVRNARVMFPRDRYLLQQHIYPQLLAGRRAWFRVFFVCGRILPCWWDDLSHVYTELTLDEESHWGLAGLRAVVRRIARLMRLDFFTAEVVLGPDGRLSCVDYANAPCDLRLQSETPDGVPDHLVTKIIDALLCEPDGRLAGSPCWTRGPL